MQLSREFSLSTVIPQKYLNIQLHLSIIFNASGYTKDFINRIHGTIYYDQTDPRSIMQAIINSKKIDIDMKKRKKFLSNYTEEKVYSKYASHILDHI